MAIAMIVSPTGSAQQFEAARPGERVDPRIEAELKRFTTFLATGAEVVTDLYTGTRLYRTSHLDKMASMDSMELDTLLAAAIQERLRRDSGY